MGYFLNFVYDDWDEVTNSPRPNRLKSYTHQDDKADAWVLSTEPMRVFDRTLILNRKLEEVEKFPDDIFFYHVWNRNCYNNRFFSHNILPIDLEIIEFFKTHKNFHIIIMNECEFEKKQALERLDQIVKDLEMDPKRVWYIHNNEKLPEHKQELNTDINVHACRSMSTSLKYNFTCEFVEDKEPGSFFLCQNRSPRIHRYAILCLLKKSGLLDDTNWSLIDGWRFNDGHMFFKDVFNVEDILDLIHEISYFKNIETVKSKYEVDYAGLDNRDIQDIPKEPKTFENSYFNIVTETNFNDEDIHITEKSFKPFFYFQFPLILASYHHIKYFREAYPELDFFDDVIDHSYDDIVNDRDRLIAFFENVKNIYNNKEFFINFYKSNKDRFIKNHEILRNYTNEYDYQFFKKLSEIEVEGATKKLNLVYDTWDEETKLPLQMNCREIYSSFLMNRDSFVNSLNLPEENIKRFPLTAVEFYPNKQFYYFITTTPHVVSNKIFNMELPIPPQVIDYWRAFPNLNVIIANEQEYESFVTFKALHYWTKLNGLNQKQLWVSNNNIRLNDYKEKLNSDINVYSTSKVRTHIALAMMGAMPNLSYKTKKDNLFLCHNRRVRPHRYALLALLKKYNILDNCDWSLVNGWDAKNRDMVSFYSNIMDVWDISDVKEEIQYLHNIEQKKSKYEEDYTWFDDKNGTDNVNWGVTYDQHSYENSYINITTETEFDTTEIHITEKSFKAFVAYQFPLILASPKHIYEIKKRYDFDFFDDIIDHSYDDELDHRDRLFKFFNEVKRINDNAEFFIDFYEKNKNRFIKNHDLALKLTADTSDTDFLRGLAGIEIIKPVEPEQKKNLI